MPDKSWPRAGPGQVRVHRRRPVGIGNGGRSCPARGRRDAPGRLWLVAARQLNERAGEILNRYVLGTGIKLGPRRSRKRSSANTGRGYGPSAWKTGAPSLRTLVVIATGIRPNSHLARRAGLEVNQGVVVDNLLATSHPNVYAAGDVAEHHGQVYGVWGPSQYQGSIAGMTVLHALRP